MRPLRYFKEDLPREKIYSIEKSDQDYYPIYSQLIHKEIDKTKVPKDKLEICEKILRETQVINLHEKNKSKTTKKKSKRIH